MLLLLHSTVVPHGLGLPLVLVADVVSLLPLCRPLQLCDDAVPHPERGLEEVQDEVVGVKPGVAAANGRGQAIEPGNPKQKKTFTFK